MAYQKHELLGTNKDGSTPKRGPRTIHKVTEPIAHDHSRDFETNPGGSFGRDGRTPKRHAVKVHSGMHQTQGTNDAKPVTSSLIDDEKMSLDPVLSANKIGKAVPPVPGQRSRTQASEVTPCGPGVAHGASAAYVRDLHAARHANADAILNDGLAHAGPDHPVNLRAR
jgi:hypothetical protein